MKLLPGNETLLAIPAILKAGIPQLVSATGAIAPISAPTKAILDSWIPKTVPENSPIAGGNISAAVQDNLALGLTGSQRSGSRTITSVGRGEKLTQFNFQANVTILREGVLGAKSTFTLAKNLTRAQGVPYILAHRLGARQTALATVGEDWSFYYAITGQPIPGYGDGADQTIAVNFVPKNIVNIAHALGA
ncbi:hypothetical protein BKA24_001808 [Microbacterium marinum]|uniref:Uncharacterized protein n=1 Tax=Microbacterium marinum TaxID=421115 RepID=A0A7W7BSW4_9MICO|nr:hypothetical protein [Microbacterium marinum]MBB4667099.1 hypothetical protein [Microbacterium marinum]